MVVRLKDLQNNQEKPEKKGLVRLSDLSPKPMSPIERDILLQPMRVTQNIRAVGEQRKAQEQVIKSEKQKQKNEIQSAREQRYAEEPPVIRDIHRGLDKFADFVKPVSDIGMQLYTPGGGLSVITGATRSAGNLVGKVLPGLGKSAGGRATQTALTEAIVGAPLGAGQSLAQTADEREALKGAILGAGTGAVFGGAGRLVGDALQKFISRSRSVSPEFEQATRAALEAAPTTARQPLRQLGTLRPFNRDQYVSRIMEQIRDDVYQRMTPPLENPNELAKWIKPHLGDDVSLNEIRKLSYEDLRQLAEEIRSNTSMYDVARQVARERGYNLDDAFSGKIPSIRQKAAQDASRRAYGIYPESLPNVTRTSSRFDARREQLGVNTQQASQQPVEPPTARPVNEPDILQSAPEREAQEVLQRVREPRVRDRVYQYLDEAEKAARERLSKRRNIGILPQGGNDVVDYAIIGAAKLGKGTIKFSDWTEEMVKEFGESFRQYAPKVYQQSKEFLRQQERRASKEGQEAIAFNESGIGDASTFEQKISRKAPKKKESFRQKWERIRTQFVDDLAPLEGFEKRVRGYVASAEDSLYKAARMFKGVPEKAAQIVTQRLTPIVDMVEKAGYTADDLGRYALAKHTRDVNAAGYKSGFTNAEIDDVLRKYGSPVMEQAQQALVQVNRDMLQELVNSGVVSRELADVLNERWKNYIPLFRSFDDDKVEFEAGLSKALANVASPIKELKGSERAVIDPLENMIKNIYRSTNAAERNKVASQLRKLAEIDKEGQFIRRLDPDESVDRKNVVNVKVNGENVKYEVEPEVYKAMLNLDQESSNMIINILSKPASLLRAGATLTPEFSLRNPMRDVIQAFVVSKSGFNPLIDFPVGIIQAISKGRLYQDWVNNLGAYGNVMSMDRNVHRQALQRVLGEPPSKKFVNIVTGRSLIRLLRAVSETTESATKIGEYRAALRRGASPQEAAYRSRDIMDFSRAGTGIRQANRIVAFLNANIQGKSKLIRAIKENPVGTTTRALTAVTLPTVGIFAFNKQFANETQRETIDNAPDWMRNSFWLVAIPGTDTVARIPKPFDLAAIFSNLPERALEYVYQNDKEAFEGFLRQSLSEAAIPVQISGLLPFVEGMANYSFFRQGDIIPVREQNLEYRDQYDPVRTSETAKLLARGAERLTVGKGAFANFSSPRIMDNTIQGLTAGLGRYATDAIDAILQRTGAVDRPKAPSKKLEQQPLLRSFFVDPTQGGKVMDKFYNNLDKLSREKASNKLNNKTFGKSGTTDLYLAPEKDALLKSLNKSSDKVSDINKQIREIERSMTLSPQEKRRQIDDLMAQRMKIVKDAVAQIK